MKKIYITLAMLFIFSHIVHAAMVLPAFNGGFQPTAMWQAPLDTIKKLSVTCSQKAQNPSDYQDCEIQYMQQHGASAAALAFFKETHGWINDYRRYGNLTVVQALVMAADHSDAFYIINPLGAMIDVDDYELLKTIDLSAAKSFQAILKKYPKAMLWFGNHNFPIASKNKQRLIFKYQLKDGCNACARAGYAWIGFDFDKAGNLKEVKLLRLHR
jgi:hypothetical protein